MDEKRNIYLTHNKKAFLEFANKTDGMERREIPTMDFKQFLIILYFIVSERKPAEVV